MDQPHLHDDTCDAPIDLNAVGEVVGSTLRYRGTNLGSLNRARGSCEPRSLPSGGDVIFQYVPPSSGMLRASTREGSTFDTIMYARYACSGGDLRCNDDLATGVIQSEIVLPVTSGDRVLLFVDGLLDTSVGSFVLTVTLE